jgi:lysozyme
MKTLKKGSKGREVLLLQQNLRKLGYIVDADGIFGSGTETVVIRFQNDHNLAAGGIVGPNTQAVIQDLLNEKQITGIDVSHHNGPISWSAVPKNLVHFVFCKGSQGRIYQDEMMKGHMNELKRLNFIRGIYHFLTFKDVTAAEQVDNFLNCGIDFFQPGTLPPVVDVEWQQSTSLNQYILDNKAACVEKLSDWLRGVETATGRKPVIYTVSTFWHDYLDDPAGFSDYPLWVASYRPDAPVLPAGWPDYAFWQYTAKASIAGITGELDMNKFNGTRRQLSNLALL